MKRKAASMEIAARMHSRKGCVQGTSIEKNSGEKSPFPNKVFGLAGELVSKLVGKGGNPDPRAESATPPPVLEPQPTAPPIAKTN